MDVHRPRVTVVDHTASLGGAELALVRLLDAVGTKRFDIEVVLFEEGPLKLRLEQSGASPVTVISLDTSLNHSARHALLRNPFWIFMAAARTLHIALRLARHVTTGESDLIVANSLKSAVVCAITATMTRKRWVWHLHDRLSDDYLPRPVARAMRLLASRADVVVANSTCTLESVRLRSGTGKVAYPGLLPAQFQVPADHVSRSPGPTIGMVGRLSPTKGQDVFLRAARLVHRTHPEARFVVVGAALFNDLEYGSSLADLAARLGLRDYVEFQGWVDDTSTAMSRMDVVVHASPTPEPFGQVIVEAMAVERAVIATYAGGMREIVDPHQIVQPQLLARRGVALTEFCYVALPGHVDGLAEAMRGSIDDETGTRRRVSAARRSVRDRFGIDRTAGIVNEAWREAIGSEKCMQD